MRRAELLPTLTLRLSPALAHRAALGGGRRGGGRRGGSSSISYTAPSTCRDALCRYNLCPLSSASNPCSEGTWLGKKTDLLLCSCLELQETPGIWACPCSRLCSVHSNFTCSRAYFRIRLCPASSHCWNLAVSSVFDSGTIWVCCKVCTHHRCEAFPCSCGDQGLVSHRMLTADEVEDAG